MLDLSPETVNRPASTQETPLKIAIDVGNADIVGQLIELGADIRRNVVTRRQPFVMQYLVFADGRDPTSLKQEQRYCFAGKIKADV